MDYTLDIPEYSEKGGLALVWEPGSSISLSETEGRVSLQANRAGFVSLARHLLTLAQDDVPEWCHVHLDETNAFEMGSLELVLSLENTVSS